MGTAPSTTLGPAAVAFPAGPATVGDTRTQREVTAPTHLDGPPGYLQGGLCAGLALALARDVDPHRAPATSVDLRLSAPTPLGEPLSATTGYVAAGEHDVVVAHGSVTLGTAHVVLAGHELVPHVGDLQELSQVVLPEARDPGVFQACWACGSANPRGLHLLPAWHDPTHVVVPWIPAAEHADERGAVDPVVACAVLDCPTLWASWEAIAAAGHAAALLASYRVTFYVDAPVDEPLRVVAAHDALHGRTSRARSALVDEDGIVYATASALWVGVDAMPARVPRQAGDATT